jgi:hypothetical protein
VPVWLVIVQHHTTATMSMGNRPGGCVKYSDHLARVMAAESHITPERWLDGRLGADLIKAILR